MDRGNARDADENERRERVDPAEGVARLVGPLPAAIQRRLIRLDRCVGDIDWKVGGSAPVNGHRVVVTLDVAPVEPGGPAPFEIVRVFEVRTTLQKAFSRS